MSVVAVLAVLSVLVAAAAVVWWIVAARRHRVEAAERLPTGADAALWSIVEVVPDPRNHLALTRDLTGEVRITATALDAPRPPAPVRRVGADRPAPAQGRPAAAGGYTAERYDKAS